MGSWFGTRLATHVRLFFSVVYNGAKVKMAEIEMSREN